MLKKYKNGFFFDTEMKTKTGEIIDCETQLKRYKIGTKANWRNPNSTDVKTINENEYDQIGSYINKYLNKKEEDKNIHQIKIDRYWTCNKELTNLQYITINEDQLKYEEQHLIFLNQNKIIYNEKKQPTCKLHSRIISETIETIERTAVTKTKILFITLTISDTINTKIDHKKLFKNYNEKIQYTIGNYNYISKIEFQENGNIHWHIMQDKEVDWRIVRGIWNKTQTEYVNGYQKKCSKDTKMASSSILK